jgi:predicted dehydrogenase
MQASTTHSHYIKSSSETIISAVQEAVSSQKHDSILLERPVTLDYFDLQKIAHQLPQKSQVSVNYQLRLAPEVQQLRQQVSQAISSGNTTILSVSVNTINNGSESSSIDTQDIDLVLSLVNQDVASVQAFNEKPLAKEADVPAFTLISGTFLSGTTFSVQLRSLKTSQNLSIIQVVLSNGEVFNATVKLDSLQGNTQDRALYANLQDAIRVTRVYITALESLRTEKSVTLKHAKGEVVAARTIGTAVFLDVGFFIPAYLTKGVAITSMFSGKEDKIREIFNRIASSGEPLEYVPSYEELLNHKESRKLRPIFYTPSIPGTRKDLEMLDALKAGYLVLAEKPAFANADLAKEFLKKLELEQKKRLFFGWHYQHHYVLKKVYQDVVKNTFGKIKHIRTFFSVPMTLKDNRIFDPSQGGAGVDIFSYNLHCTLRLIGFENSYQVVQSKIQSAQDLDPSLEKLKKIDFVLDVKLAFGNGVTADLFATFDSTTVMHSEAEIEFEDGTRVFLKEFVHFQNIIGLGFSPAVIKRVGSPRWEDYVTEEDKNHPDYVKSSYDAQLEFMRKQSTGEDNYDLTNDTFGLSMESNIKLGEIIDDIFLAGGFEKKPGA